MKYRLYGQPKRIVVHGGPGAIGSCSGLAQSIGDCVELLNYGQSIDEQLIEIKNLVEEFEMKAPVLIGHSWGAWLSFIYASKYKVAQLYLVGCGAFEEKYLSSMNDKRDSRLTEEERQQVQTFFKCIQNNEPLDMQAFGKLMSKMDSYDQIDYKDDSLAFDAKGHDMLMSEIRLLRSSGALLELGKNIKAEVYLIHGKYDPHPIEGITEPFEKIDLKYDLNLLDKCGHTPWHERHAASYFKDLMKDHLSYLFKSDRLGFRFFTSDDKEFFRRMNSDDQVMTYFPNKLDDKASDQFLDRIINNYDNTLGLYAVEILETKELIGFIGLSKPSFDMDFTPCVEIGWRLYKDYWKQGYAVEGARRVLEYAADVLELNEVYSFTATSNKASINVMKRIGLEYIKNFDHPKVEGRLKEHVLYKVVLVKK